MVSDEAQQALRASHTLLPEGLSAMTTKTADAALMRLILKKQAAKPALLLNSVDIVACFLLIGNIKKGIP
ncbi:hypothetical protein A7P97_00185 [Eikenella sp. NML070372]|nr:hypothetical protein A7P97_00185 [Eikenella sp. NML070372]